MVEVEEADEDDSLPEFFKVYITLHSSHKMLMPHEFVNYLEENKSGHCKLTGPSGKTWGVELVEEGEDVYFTDGWKAFVNDNMVRDGEFIFFKLHGNLVFSVTIYDDSMCEKVLLYSDQRSEGLDVVQEAVKEEDVKHMKMRSVKHSRPKGFLFPSKVKTAQQTPTSVNPSFEKRVSMSNLKDGCYFAIPSSFVREHSLRYEDYEKMVLQTGGISSWEVSVINTCNCIILRKGWPAFARANNIRVGDVCKFQLVDRLKMLVHVTRQQDGNNPVKEYVAASKKKSGKKAAAVPQHSLKCGLAEQKPVAKTTPTLANSSFVLQMRKYNVEKANLVNIPSWFVQENLLNYKRKEKMVLRTSTDSSWLVTITRNKTVCHLCGGWAEFVCDNNIKEGDTCEFELVKRLEMRVHITRCFH